MLFCFLSPRRERWQWQSHHSVSRVPHIWRHNRQGISQRADLPNKCTQVKPHTDSVLHTLIRLLRVIHCLISAIQWDEVSVAFFQESFSFCRDAYSSMPVDGSAESWMLLITTVFISIAPRVLSHIYELQETRERVTNHPSSLPPWNSPLFHFLCSFKRTDVHHCLFFHASNLLSLPLMSER